MSPFAIFGIILLSGIIFLESFAQESAYDQKVNQAIWFFGILLGIIVLAVFWPRKKKQSTIATITETTYSSPRKGWTEVEKEQVRIRQDGKCAKCNKPPPRWEYHHIDGNRTNNDLSNCEGLCPNCHSVKTHDSEHF